jgi:Protein of unknown function (DUF3619)
MNEREFAKKVTMNLNWGLTQIDGDKLAKLRAAREKAMANYVEPIAVAATSMATTSGQTTNVSTNWMRRPLFWLPVLAIALAAITYNTLDDDIADDAGGELDAKLLTGELPINAFLDKDFGSWVKESSQ